MLSASRLAVRRPLDRKWTDPLVCRSRRVRAVNDPGLSINTDTTGFSCRVELLQSNVCPGTESGPTVSQDRCCKLLVARDHSVMAIAVRNVHDGRRKPTLDTIVYNPRPTHSTTCVCSNAHVLQTTQVHANTQHTRQNILSAPWLVVFDREHYWDSASTRPSSCIAQTYSTPERKMQACAVLNYITTAGATCIISRASSRTPASDVTTHDLIGQSQVPSRFGATWPWNQATLNSTIAPRVPLRLPPPGGGILPILARDATSRGSSRGRSSHLVLVLPPRLGTLLLRAPVQLIIFELRQPCELVQRGLANHRALCLYLVTLLRVKRERDVGAELGGAAEVLLHQRMRVRRLVVRVERSMSHRPWRAG